MASTTVGKNRGPQQGPAGRAPARRPVLGLACLALAVSAGAQGPALGATPADLTAWGARTLADQRDVKALSAFLYNAVALKNDGTLVTWYDREHASAASVNFPGGNGFTAVAAGEMHALALKSDGTVVAWGGNTSGQCDVPSGLAGVTAVAAGGYHSLALKNDGTVVAWGRNTDYGGDTVGQCTGTAGWTSIIAIAAGEYFSLALKNDGTVLACGDDSSGQATVPGGLGVVTALAAGTKHSLAVLSDGTVVAWGDNGSGQRNVPADLSGVTAVAGGDRHSVALKDDGTVVAWGAIANVDARGQTSVPAGLSGISAITAGGLFTLALGSDGLVTGWGEAHHGQTHVPASLGPVLSAAAGGEHTVAVQSDGTVVCWGSNLQGQCTPPSGLSGVTAVAAGYQFSLALKNDHTVAVWGDDQYGQLSNMPAGLNNVTALAAGWNHSLALKSDTTVVAWGQDYYGQSTGIPQGLSGVIEIAAGEFHSVALKSDGTVRAWGRNTHGEIEVDGQTNVAHIGAGASHTVIVKNDGTITVYGSILYGQGPAPGGLSGVAAFSGGQYHTLARKSDGTVVAWSDNLYDQCSVPSGLNNVTAVSAGALHNAALTSTPGPVVSGISPAHAPATIPTAVTITGSGFAGSSVVWFGGSAPTNVSKTSTQITCTTPAHAPGTVSVTVVNVDGQTGGMAFTFDPGPTIRAISPIYGPPGSTTPVTLTGRYFSSSASVSFGGTPPATTPAITSTRITCSAPAHAAGTVNVTVTNPDTQSGAALFVYGTPPSITSLSPNHGPATLTRGVTISGSSFQANATVVFGGVSATNVSVPTSTQITCTAPTHAAGTVSVVVTNPDTLKASSGYTFDPGPNIADITPDAAVPASATPVTLVGASFVSGATVTFGGTSGASVSVPASGTITCTAPTHAAGTVTVMVTNPDNQSASFPYIYGILPKITSITPTHGPATLTQAVTIVGASFNTNASVKFGGTPATNLNINSTKITCTAPTHAAGTFNVVVANDPGAAIELTATVPYTFDAGPAIASLSPARGPETLPIGITLAGTGFSTGTPKAVVSFGGTAPTNLSVTSTQITCTAPTRATSTAAVVVSVTVTNADSQVASVNYTCDPPPAIASVTPAQALATVPTPVTFNGTNFVSGTPCSTVLFGSLGPANTPVITSTRVTCTAPTQDGGYLNLVITNPDGQTASVSYLMNWGPAVSSITPTHGPARLATTVVLSGQYFSTAAVPTVQFLGAPASLSAHTATTLTCTAPTRSAGTAATITVTNPDTQTTTFYSYTYDSPPLITSFLPTEGRASMPTPMTIVGGYFVSGTTLKFGATDVSATVDADLCHLYCTAPTRASGAVTVTVTNPDTQTGTRNIMYIKPPTGSTISLTHGPATLPTPVTITGTDFMTSPTPASVMFGSNAAALQSLTATALVCTTPASNPGTVTVSVVNPDGQTAAQTWSYTFDAGPAISSLTPNHGLPTVAMPVTLAGTNFSGSATVTFGGVTPSNLVIAGTRITCTAPTHDPGAVSVVVTNPDNQTASVTYTYDPPPSISGISPPHGRVTMVTAVTITGACFAGNATVTLGGVTPPNLVIVSSTQITCTAPTRAAGTVNFVITNPDTRSTSAPYPYDLPPAASTISRTEGPALNAVPITITGTDFMTGATVTFGSTLATNVSVVSVTQITCMTPTHDPGTVSVAVGNPDGQTASHTFPYLYDAGPVISGLNPSHGAATLSTQVTLSGLYFSSGATVTFGGLTPGNIAITSTRITCTAPTHDPGTVSVVVAHPDAQSSSVLYTYDPPPQIITVTPVHLLSTISTPVTMDGTNFVDGATVSFGGTPSGDTPVVTSTRITCTAPTHSPGLVSVVVTNPDNQTSSMTLECDPAPSITSISPPSAPATQPTMITILGANFVGGEDFAVTVDGTGASNVTVSSSTRITCQVSQHPAGTVGLMVQNPDGQSTSAPFTYAPPPAISGLSPAHGAATLERPVTISGSGFLGTPTVWFGGNPAPGVSATATQLTCTAPVHAPGTVSVVVTNPDNQTALVNYTYDPPLSVSSISPAHGPATLPKAVTLSGSSFDSGATVTFGGVAATHLSISCAQITCTAPTGSSGTLSVVVTNADSQTAGVTYTYDPPPSLTGLSPAGYSAAGGGRVTLTGSAFSTTGAPAVNFDGAEATLVSVHSGTLVCVIPAHTNPFPALKLTVNVALTNPDAQSAGRTFQCYADIEGNVYPQSTGGSGVRPTIFDVGLVRQFISAAKVPSRGIEFQKTDCYPPATRGDGKLDIFDVGQLRSYVSGAALSAAAGPAWYAPMVTRLTPNLGPGTGRTPVTITGNYFETGGTVTFGGSGASDVVVVSPTQITCSTPPHATGAVTVTVTNSEGTAGSKVNGFTYQAPGPGGSESQGLAPTQTTGILRAPRRRRRRDSRRVR